jgi:septum formation protein
MPHSQALRFVLASTSPARKRLLTDAGLSFETLSPGVDEESLVESLGLSHSSDIVATLARAKAEAGVAAIGQSSTQSSEPALVLGCDSALQFGGESLGKPLTPAAASERWRAMRGSSGELYSGHWLIDSATGRAAGRVTKTEVHFADISDHEINRYVATGEPLRVAGAFTIDGLGGGFIERIQGDYHTVVGLSLVALRELVHELGHSYVELWSN